VQIPQNLIYNGEIMGKFILFIGRLIYLYLYFIVGACVLSWVPNINPQYPLFKLIFNMAGAGIFPPVLGFDIGPVVLMSVLGLIWAGLEKIYKKFYAPKDREIIIISKDELLEKLKEQKEDSEVKDNNVD
jgi:uncharacterized protein YggT (Ycf19 family)